MPIEYPKLSYHQLCLQKPIWWSRRLVYLHSICKNPFHAAIDYYILDSI